MAEKPMSPSFMATDEPPCDHAPLIEEITRGRGLLIKIKALLLLPPPSPPTNLCSELAGEILESLDRALSLLRRRSALHLVAPRDGSPKPNHGARIKSSKNLGEGDEGGGRKRGRQQQSSIIETSDPDHYDGHQWRKYGEKPINGAVHPKLYYRCTYHKDRRCPAKKTVQRKDGGHEPPEFFVTYTMEHSCRRIEPAIPSVVRVLSFGSNNWRSSGGGGGGGGGRDDLGESSSVGQIRDPGGSPMAETHPLTDPPILQESSWFAQSRNHECSSTADAPPVTGAPIPEDGEKPKWSTGDVDSNMFPLMDPLELSSVAQMIAEWENCTDTPGGLEYK